MTIEEIFGHLSAHMVEGIMTHSQLADYYNFIGLKGYAKCHEYHYICENKGFRNLSHYLLEHHNKLVPELSSSNPNIIPDSWFNYSRQDVDTATRKTAIQLGAETWVNWERKTKMLYQNMYNELIAINEIAAAIEIKKYIVDVDNELAEAQQKQLECKAIDYDIFNIMDEQDKMYKKYEKEINNVKY